MGEIDGGKRRALEPYLKFLRRLDDDVDLETRVGHVLDEFSAEDFADLGNTLAELDLTAGFSVPARHLEERPPIRRAIGDLANDGHEVLLHGSRHTSFMDVPDETARAELARASEVIEDVTGRAPTGFHVPYGRASPGTLRAATELGVEWLVGSPADGAQAPADLALLQPVRPYDLQLIERGTDPEQVFERLSANAAEAAVYLCHPNVHVPSGTAPAFADWLEAEAPPAPDAVAAGGCEGPGLLLDCFPPFRVR
jgi:hypothetical protein